MDEDALAKLWFAGFATMRAETDEERAAEELLSKSIDRRYAERKVAERWLQTEQAQEIFSIMPYDRALRRRELEMRMQLTPTSHLMNMLKDIKNDDVDLFRWANGFWRYDLDINQA